VAIAVVVAVLLAELWLAGGIILLEQFSSRPLLVLGILLAVLVLLVLCIIGARRGPHPIVRGASAAVLLFASAAAAIASLEQLHVGLINLGFDRPTAYRLLTTGTLCAAVSAAGIKYVFRWRLAYWIIFVAVLFAILASGIAAGFLTFF
jgi:hypothetical protein